MLRDRALCALGMAGVLLILAGQGAPAGERSTLDVVKSRGTLLAGVKYDTPPFGFVDQNNQVVGFDVDLVKEIARALNVKADLVKVTSPTRIPMLVAGNVDLVAASMTHTAEREKTIDFSITYYTGAQTLLVPVNSSVTGLKDLDGKTVAVQQGTTLEKNLAALAPGAKPLPFRDYTSAWLAVRQGRADALTGSTDILRGFQKNAQGFTIVGEKFSVEPFGIGIRKGDAATRDFVNKVLRDLWVSRRYHELYRKWFEVDPDVPLPGAP